MPVKTPEEGRTITKDRYYRRIRSDAGIPRGPRDKGDNSWIIIAIVVIIIIYLYSTGGIEF